ncbi:MAG: extracellular solute-binding protein [Clostridia bacterium]|nr:extracellular solute-binding protein [Clostridia bacterium]
MKKFLALLLALVMTLSMASLALADAPSTVVVWATDGAETVVYTQMFEDFNANHTDIQVDFQPFPQDELLNKLSTADVVGDTPDVIIIDGLQIPYYQDLDMIACIDEYVTDEMKQDVLPSIWAENTYDGKIYGVAQFDSGMGMWTRRSVLESLGVRIPVSYKEAWTVEEFEEILQKAKDAGYAYPLYIRQNKVTSLYFTWMPIIASYGGDFLNRDTMTATGALDSEGTIKAYDWMKKMIDAGFINPACDYEDAFFGREEALFSMLGHWKYSDHVGAFGDDAIIVPMPDFGGGVYTCSGSTVVVMTQKTVDDGKGDLAWTVIDAIMSPEYIGMVCAVNGGVPARSSVMDTMPEWQEGGRLYLYREQLEAGISYLRPITPAHATVYNAVANVVTDILAGTGEPADLLHAAAADVDEIIYENGWNIE